MKREGVEASERVRVERRKRRCKGDGKYLMQWHHLTDLINRGVFFFCWAGEGATVQFFLGRETGNPGLGSVLTVAAVFGIS
jgi:hypothetical protein